MEAATEPQSRRSYSYRTLTARQDSLDDDDDDDDRSTSRCYQTMVGASLILEMMRG